MWLAVSPLIAGGVLTAHTLAYRLTGTPAGSSHDYLEHAPQILLVLAVASLAFAGFAARLRLPHAWPFPVAAVATFVVQEHVERFAHTGDLPWLVSSRVFVVGVLLQLPVALVVWALARRLLAADAELPARRPQIPRLLLDIVLPASFDVRPIATTPLPSRGPPLLRRP